jgi:hypothetical protein
VERDGDAEWGTGVRQGLAVRALPGAENIVKLMQVGRRLAVLGVAEPIAGVPQADLEWWHVMNPGSYSIPSLGEKLSHGRALCGRIVVTNGYASDFTPPDGSLCPACAERTGMTIRRL